MFEENGPKTADCFEWREEDDMVRLQNLQKTQREKLELSKIDPGTLNSYVLLPNSSR